MLLVINYLFKAIGAAVEFAGNVSFTNNNAQGYDGGALYMLTSSQITLNTGAHLKFVNNTGGYDVYIKGSPTVAKSRTPYLKSRLKSLKSLKFQNLKSRTIETVISKFLYISASNHVKLNREDNIKQALSKGNYNHETS